MLPRILKNFNLYANGKGLAGVADEVELPEVSVKTDDYRAGGLDSEVEIDMGTDKMTAKFKLADPDPDILTLVGLTRGNSARIIAKGSYVRDSDGARIAVVAECNGRMKKGGLGQWKAGDKADSDYEMSVNYYKLTVGGREVYEIDVENMIRRIDGVDQLAGIRSDIGL